MKAASPRDRNSGNIILNCTALHLRPIPAGTTIHRLDNKQFSLRWNIRCELDYGRSKCSRQNFLAGDTKGSIINRINSTELYSSPSPHFSPGCRSSRSLFQWLNSESAHHNHRQQVLAYANSIPAAQSSVRHKAQTDGVARSGTELSTGRVPGRA